MSVSVPLPSVHVRPSLSFVSNIPNNSRLFLSVGTDDILETVNIVASPICGLKVTSCLVPWHEFATLHVPYTYYKDVVHFFEYYERFTFVACDVVALPASHS